MAYKKVTISWILDALNSDSVFFDCKTAAFEQQNQFHPHGDRGALRHLLRRGRFEQRQLHLAARRPRGAEEKNPVISRRRHDPYKSG